MSVALRGRSALSLLLGALACCGALGAAALPGHAPFELVPAADGRDEDRFGRKLRRVVRDGRSLGEQLVAEGLAHRWGGRKLPWCA